MLASIANVNGQSLGPAATSNSGTRSSSMRPAASPSYKLPQLRRKTGSRLRYGSEVIIGADNTASVSSNNASLRLVKQSYQPARNSRSLSMASELLVDATPVPSGVTVILDPTAIVLDL
ncbi:hypothetical protein ACTMTI_16770 [Nonomuraea sp. H19]|uniref:hypothetical protein n=1 Tax=Nonomuraea sp. H19 TaxID=3452206 RepID=UPI003F8A6883